MGFNVTSALMLIALITVKSRTLTRVQPAFLEAALATQLELVTDLLKLLRSFMCERPTLYNSSVIKSQLFSSQQTSLQYLKTLITFVSSLLKMFCLSAVNSLPLQMKSTSFKSGTASQTLKRVLALLKALYNIYT